MAVDKSKAKGKAPESAAEMDEEFANAKSLADIAGVGGGGLFEGESVTLESIKDQKVLVKAFRIQASTFREGGTYACMQVKTLAGKLLVVNTNAQVIVKEIVNVQKESLPFKCIFFLQDRKEADKSKKPYWNWKPW